MPHCPAKINHRGDLPRLFPPTTICVPFALQSCKPPTGFTVSPTPPMPRHWLLVGMLVALAGRVAAEQQPELPGFLASRQFAEQERWTTLESGVRVFVSAPSSLVSGV